MSSLVTIQDFAGYLKRDLDEADAYTAQLMLDGAGDAVIEYCGWHIAPIRTETVTVDGTGTGIQTLPTLNLLALNSVAEDGHVLDPAHIDWSSNGLMEKRWGAGWTRRRRGVAATLTHGYATTPGWLTTLMCAVAGRAFTTPLGVVQETAGGESVSYARSTPGAAVMLLPFEKKMLDRVRVPLAA